MDFSFANLGQLSKFCFCWVTADNKEAGEEEKKQNSYIKFLKWNWPAALV